MVNLLVILAPILEPEHLLLGTEKRLDSQLLFRHSLLDSQAAQGLLLERAPWLAEASTMWKTAWLDEPSHLRLFIDLLRILREKKFARVLA